LAFPVRTSAPRGDSQVQIQRTIPRNCYSREQVSPEGRRFPITNGEYSIYSQYLQAIDGAKRTIYIENQAVENLDVVLRLHSALERGVRVAILAPAFPADVRPDAQDAYRALAELWSYEGFTMATLNATSKEARYGNVHVHSKIMLIDDAFATIGSCNIRTRAFFEHTEMNASVRDAEFARSLRNQLLQEHLDLDTHGLTDVEALRLFADVARRNIPRSGRAGHDRQGIAVQLGAPLWFRSFS